ncbi:hypothetical protein KZP23_21465 [Echinicola marina]|uniref:hypothetical protein n=1 Tax=Echinicola marina TaxID=2859768 RepID=UPI001CF6F042|nr:hypothetical protein [Echinicola marina]UCS93190.1 hypothetical protein KZP23_21465 [Echinicola marina]
MRNLFLISFLFCSSIFACSEVGEDPEIIIDPSISFVTGDWELVEVSGGFKVEDSPEPEELNRKDIYTFTNEGTFIKTVDYEGFHAEATGTYVIKEVTEEFEEEYVGVVVLSFTGGDDIAYNCTSQDIEKESLYISKEGQLANISWAPCDGLFMYYEKKK